MKRAPRVPRRQRQRTAREERIAARVARREHEGELARRYRENIEDAIERGERANGLLDILGPRAVRRSTVDRSDR